MWDNIIERVFRNWKTSCTALCLAGFAVYLLEAGLVDWPQWSLAMSGSVLFLFAKDPKSGTGPDKTET